MHVYYLDEAAQEAIKSDMKSAHGCVIVYRNSIVARGYNIGRAYNDAHSLHAEAAALQALQKRYRCGMRGCDVYVVRVRKTSGLLGLSKPCNKCEHLLRRYINDGIVKRVFYSVERYNKSPFYNVY